MLGLEVRLHLVGVGAHRAELEAGERLAADAGAEGAVDDRPARGDDDRERAGQQQRASSSTSRTETTEVERALDEVVDAVEDGRAQLEQRDRRAGHELGALDEDLHRRRRDPHGHAALVALVDELDGALLREVRVGDDHFLDAVRRRGPRARSSIRPSERRPLSGRGVSEMKPTISTGACTSSVSACATSSMWRPEPTSTARRR